MSTNAATAAVKAALLAGWTDDGVHLRTPISFENQGGYVTTVDERDGLLEPPEGQPWIRLTVQPGVGRQTDLNPKPFIRSEGQIEVQIFIPRGWGTERAEAYADQIFDLFEGRKIGPLRCRSRRIVKVGEDHQWWQLNAIVPTWRDEVRAA